MSVLRSHPRASRCALARILSQVLCQSLLFCFVVGSILGAARYGHAQSGETEEAAGIFQAECGDLRETTGVDADVIFTCDADRQACELNEAEIDQIGIGFCADSFPEGVRVVTGDEPLKQDVAILASTFGGDTGVELSPPEGTPADILCETFVHEGEGVRACRRIIKDEAGCSAEGSCPICNDRRGEEEPVEEFIVTSSDSCDDIEEQLADAVTGVTPDLAFALLISLQNLGSPRSEALLVCPGFRWECVDETADPFEGNVAIEYQIPKAVISEDPDCLRIGGRRVC